MKEFTYKYEITIHGKEDVETLFNIIEKFKEGSIGTIKPLDKQSLEITTSFMSLE